MEYRVMPARHATSAPLKTNGGEAAKSVPKAIRKVPASPHEGVRIRRRPRSLQ